jgi:hypothetical protein
MTFHLCSISVEDAVEKYLREPVKVPIDRLYPDPNNPRLALEEPPGYSDPATLFNEETRKRIFEELGHAAYDVNGLVEAIVGQGWMPIDNIIVWHHPADGDRYVVVEGNRRRLALERIRGNELEKARNKLRRMQTKPTGYAKYQIEQQEADLAHLERVVGDTDELQVVPIDADSIEELERKLPRVLAVRHITGTKVWGNYAEDLWLLNRYHQLFEDQHGSATDLFWDARLIAKVGEEGTLTPTKAKRQLKAASWYSHFRAQWEDELPEGESFKKEDYFLFENISKKPWLRQQFSIGEDALAIPPDSEQVLFDWVFAKPRGKTADENPNVFHAHQNLLLWDQMKRYDDDNSTAFAARFDVANADEAPTMHEVEAEWRMHKVRKKPHAVLDELLRRLGDLTAETLATEGRVLRVQLEQLRDHAERFIKMIDAAEA